jgi:predicted flap endonuclease-1-like 5' DNA nuclease
MGVDRSTRTFIATFFLLAAVLVAVNHIVSGEPLASWWLPLLLFIIGAGVGLTAWFEREAAEADEVEPAATSGVKTFDYLASAESHARLPVSTIAEPPPVVEMIEEMEAKDSEGTVADLGVETMAVDAQTADASPVADELNQSPLYSDTQARSDALAASSSVDAGESQPEPPAAPPDEISGPPPVESPRDTLDETPAAEPTTANSVPESAISAPVPDVGEAPHRNTPEESPIETPAVDTNPVGVASMDAPTQTADRAAEADDLNTSFRYADSQVRSDALAASSSVDADESEPEPAASPEDKISEIGGSPLVDTPPRFINPDGKDNLQVIEGIGPKMAAALISAGLDSFEKLSNATEADIRAAIQAAGMRFAPSVPTWPEQAGYAQRSDWDGLKEFQKTLMSGRRG